MINNKFGQMKIQQMAFMLIAVTLFLVMAGMFILVIRFSSLQDTAELLCEKNALLLVSKIADSPEFSCGNAFGKPRSNCVDTDKVMALTGRLQDYSGFWGVDGIEIRRIFPAETGTECTLENYPECKKITILDSGGKGTGVSNFVSLCRKESQEDSNIYDKCELGKIIITYGGLEKC
ncbi:MAG: hypothetical protein U1B79_00740 [Candidatus Pacearchaeota archaeon]|nr:hypothetical protein [Nanoarchaeota archaeon]MDZ4226619.1 hypothetical protein [Candidatus Pacearchaeota archaeon]